MLLKYLPKRLHFSMPSMIARTELAVMDFNSGAFCEQSKTTDGSFRYKLQYSRISNSWVTKGIKEKKEKSFISVILEKVESLRESKSTVIMPDVSHLPKCLEAQSKPIKTEALKQKQTRFSKTP